ncbi:MAG: ATP-binding cassette domain-containing protein [Dehalococcoidia bacterium]|nr:ATP-binding cassette domain-containing protein [Dehalococcoidia bacterium]
MERMKGTRSGMEYRWALEVQDLWFSYNGTADVLRGVNLRVEKGLLTMLLGRSGSGKTTLLKVVKGLLKPQKGALTVLGVPFAGERKSASREVAYIPQNLGLVRNLTALENTLTGALGRSGPFLSLLKVFSKETVEEARECLALLGLEGKHQEKAYNLSGGERQRVAIARALMQRPRLILADEFVSQLDPVMGFEIMEMVREIARKGVSLLITTHEMGIAARYGDRAVVMKEGMVVYEGTPYEVGEEGMLELLR